MTRGCYPPAHWRGGSAAVAEATADGVGGLRLLMHPWRRTSLAPSKRERPPPAFALRATARQAPSPAVALAKAGPRYSLRSGGGERGHRMGNRGQATTS